jgi:uncharacterized protein (TIGR02118 family)
MVKLMMLFKHPPNETKFEDDYVQALAYFEKMAGIQRQQANMVFGSPQGRSPYYRVLELYFDSYEALDKALVSPEGQAAGQYLMSYAENLVEVLFVDVLEENYDQAG